jgi:carbonic anhydrase
VQTLWDNIPAQGSVKTLPGALEPRLLLPVWQGYYAFQGSLTTPPCTEGVQWFVLQSPLTISIEQERTFAKLYPDNARPLQPRNRRTVEVSK